jgi:hypothetical protein
MLPLKLEVMVGIQFIPKINSFLKKLNDSIFLKDAQF